MQQAVANELVSLFLDENTRVRTQRAAKTTEFLSAEAEKLKTEIQAFETQIVDYKSKFGKSLPEMLQTNHASINRAREDLRDADSDIRIARDRIVYLTDSLRQAKDDVPAAQPDKPLTKEEQLRILKSQFIHLSSLDTPKHPDAQRVKRQIQILEPGFTGETTGLDTRKELTQAENELAMLKERYAPNHPDLIKQQQRVAKLTKTLNDATSQENMQDDVEHQDSALYMTVTNQLRATQHELEQLLKRKEELQKNIEELQSHINETPLVEKEYLELLRMRQTSLNKYADLEAKHREAKLAQTLEEEQKGETFTLIEPPIAPEKPEKPDREKIMLLGLGLGIALGLALTVLLELLNEVIRGPKALERITGKLPVVVIPYIETPMDRALRKRRLTLIWIISAVIIIAAIALTHFFVMPLGQIWATTLMKLGRL